MSTLRRISPPCVVVAALSCAQPTPAPPPPDVILVTLDTLRADRLGAYGYASAKTETIDALAAAGRRYQRAYSPVPLTIPSHASVMTGRYPAALGVRGNGDGKLPEEATTLAEVFRERGYTTGASVAAFVTSRVWGFQQGFDAFYDDLGSSEQNLWHAERSGDRVVDDAISWWTAQPAEKPRFLWVHLYDAHFPYLPPPSYAADSQGRLYDGEIAFVDDQIERLRALAAGRNVLWVLVGDHGESLGEHGELMHGLFVYEATQRVPFILSGAGVTPGVANAPVALADVAPTVLDHLGIPRPPAMTGRPAPNGLEQPIYMEAWSLRDRFHLAPHRAVIDGDYLFIDVPEPELYAVGKDPAQAQNLALSETQLVATLRARLNAFGFAAPSTEQQDASDPTIAAQLAALGYTEGSFSGPSDAPLLDPKDHLPLIRMSQRGERLDQEQQYDEAAKLYRQLIQDYPHITEFRNRLAMDLERTERRGEAIQLMREVVANEPENHQTKSTLAALLGRDGKHAEAAALFEACAAALPYSDRMRHGAVYAWLADGNIARAIELGERWTVEYPDDQTLSGIYGLALWRSGDLVRAEPLLMRGMSADLPPVNAGLRLYELALGRGDAEAATRWLVEEVEAHPENGNAGERLIPRLSEAKRWEELARFGRMLARANPETAIFWHSWAQAEFNRKNFAASRTALNEGLRQHPKDALLVLLDANLLAQEGDAARAQARFTEAQALHTATR